jgi:serine phosphatase RsbU (regulator of sigma subunit)
MKKLIALILFSAVAVISLAQQGFPLLSHFKESRESENQSWAICQDENQVMLFANRKGILTFDGHEWQQAAIPVIPYAMRRNPSDGKIYIGGENNYGLLERDLDGKYNYISLSDGSAVTGAITRIVFNDSLIWFYSDRIISRFNTVSQKADLVMNSKPENPFTGMFITPKNTFINVYNKGLFRLDSDTLFPIVTGYLTEREEILFSLPYNNTLVLTGLSSGKLSLFDGIKYYNYPVKDEGYLRANILSEGIMLGDTAYAFSTLDGGVLVVERLTGKLLFTINNMVGLPDDEVFATGCDNSGGLWLSHQYGLTRADLNLPVRDFSTYPGLFGNLSSSLYHNNELYIASSEGIFYLTEIKNYDEVQILVKSEREIVPVIPEPGIASKTTEPDVQEQQPARKGILSRIFGGRTAKPSDKQQEVTGTIPEAIPEPVLQQKQSVQEYTRKTVSKLRSIDHIYRKVAGLTEKCRQIVSTPFGILAATNRGLYVINNKTARLIVPDRYINSISWSPSGDKYYISANTGWFSVKNEGGKWHIETPDPSFTNPVFSVFESAGNVYWLGGDSKAYRGEASEGVKGLSYKEYQVNNEYPQRYSVELVNDSLFLFTESGVYFYEEKDDMFKNYPFRYTSAEQGNKFRRPLSNKLLLNINGEWFPKGSSSGIERDELSILKIFDDVVSVTASDDNLWVISSDNRLYNIDRRKASEAKADINIMIKRISNNKGTSFNLTNVKFNRGDDVIIFDIVAPGYLKQNITQYQYYIEKVMTGWSDWSVQTRYEKAIKRSGDYTLQVRARDIWGNIGEPQSVEFTIKAPFTRTALFYILCITTLLVVFILIVRIREKQLQIKNRILEEKVKERTAEIEAQKEEITSSIEYASRIQHAMLPMEEQLRKLFEESFIFFHPRDIVSGDFYWIGEDDKSLFISVADCTGHGVPGAFMSTLGMSTLNEIIANTENLQANVILDLLRNKIKTTLHQTGKAGEAVDGMDMAFCVINKNKKSLQFAGAFNSMILVRKGELTEFKADSMPIGIYYGAETPFRNQVIKLSKGDELYLFSDGFPDQFGGPEGSKFKKANLKRLFIEMHGKPMREQKRILGNVLSDWIGDTDQIDDITILGFRI